MTFEEEKEGLGLVMPETATGQSWVHDHAQAESTEYTLGLGRQEHWAGTCGRKRGLSGAAVEVLSTAKQGLCGDFDQQMVSKETLASNSSGL